MKKFISNFSKQKRYQINSIFDNKLTVNTLSLSFIYALNFLISLLTLPYLIKNYGTSNWGDIVFHQIILNYLIWLIDWSFNLYSAKFISINSDNYNELKRIFNETKTAQLILLIFSLLISSIILLILGSSILLLISFSIILIGSYLHSFWYLNGLERIYETAIIQLLNKFLFAFFILFLINKNSTIETYFLYYGISTIATGIFCQLRLSYKYNNALIIVGFKKGFDTLKKSSKLFTSSIVSSLINSSIPLLISFLLGNNQLGIYNVADRIKSISSQLVHPISHSIFPKMAKEYSKDKASGNKYLKLILIVLTSITLISYLLINLYINAIISYFSNENIILISGVLRILLFSFIINVLEEIMVNQYMIPNSMYSSINKVKFLILSISIFTCIPLIQNYDIKGAALANVIAEFSGLIYLISIYNKTKKISFKKPSF